MMYRFVEKHFSDNQQQIKIYSSIRVTSQLQSNNVTKNTQADLRIIIDMF